MHEWQKLLRQEKYSFEMNVVGVIQFFLSSLIKRLVQRGAGIVDQVIKALGSHSGERLAHTLNEKIEGGDLGCVELQGDGLASRLAHDADHVVSFGLIRMERED